MKKTETVERLAGVSNDAVRVRTGRSWSEWLAILDAAGARAMNHKQIVAVLRRYNIGGWWQQMVTVAYEQARGLRKKHQRPEGFEVSASKTLAVSGAEAFRAWKDEKARARWLGNVALIVRKATPGRSLRLSWSDGTSVSVDFYPKGTGKCQVTVQHAKLADEKTALRMKAFWAKRQQQLKEFLER